MITDCDLISLETATRDLIGEDTPKYWTQAMCFRAINAEVARLTRYIIDLDQGYFETLYTATPTSGVLTLPRNPYKVRAVEVYRFDRWMPLSWVGAADRYKYLTMDSSVEATAFRFTGSTIVLEPNQGGITSARVIYSEAPPPLIYGTAAAGGAASLTLAAGVSPIDDIYNNQRVYVISGTSAGDTRIITDYVGSTRVATVAAWTTTTDVTTVYSTLLPDPLDRWSDLVAYGAALRLLLRRRDDNLIAMLQAQYQLDLSRMLESLKRRQTDQSPRVRFIPDLDEMGVM